MCDRMVRDESHGVHHFDFVCDFSGIPKDHSRAMVVRGEYIAIQ